MINRRNFLGGLGSLASAAFVGSKLRSEKVSTDIPRTVSNEGAKGNFLDSNLDKQQRLENSIAAIQQNLRHPDVLEALEGRGKDPLSVILGAIEIPILPEHIEGTKYGVDEIRQRYSVQVEILNSNGERRSIGNGVFFRDSKIQLTAAHVVDGSTSTIDPHPNGVDAALPKITDARLTASPEQIVYDDPNTTNADIHGQFVVVVGFDPDSTSDESGYKTYPGVAVKVTPGLAHHLYGNWPHLVEKVQNSFMLVLPPGEAKSPAHSSEDDASQPTGGKKYARVAGMSGSGMFVHHEGRYVFGGTFWSALSMKDVVRKRSVDIGFIHGIDDIRRAFKLE